MRRLIPVPSQESMPSEIADGLGPLADVLDAQFDGWMDEAFGIESLKDPARMPPAALDEAGYMLAAGFSVGDDDRVKRAKVVSAVRRNTLRGLWEDSVKPAVEARSGAAASIVDTYGMDDFILVGKGGYDTELWGALGGSGADESYGARLYGGQYVAEMLSPWGSYDFATVPAYPDDPAGTTYRNVDGWTTGVDGFNSDGTADISISDGKLKSNSKDSLYNYFLARRTITSISNGFVAMKVYCNFNGNINLRNGSTVATPFASASVTVGQTVYISGIASGAMTALYIDARPSVVPSVVTNYISIFDVYIGTGATLTPPIDNSGNGHHLTANALIPVVDATAPGGRYVKLSGQPSYFYGTMTGFYNDLCLSGRVYFPAPSTTEKVVVESGSDYTANDGAFGLLYNQGGISGRLMFAVRTAPGSYLSCYKTVTVGWHDIIAKYRRYRSGYEAIFLSVDGNDTVVMVGTDATRPPVYNGTVNFGCRNGSSKFFDGWFAGNLEVFNAAEKRAIGFIDRGTVLIDTGSDAMTDNEVASLVEDLRDLIPAYFTVYLGYMDGSTFVDYENGRIN